MMDPCPFSVESRLPLLDTWGFELSSFEVFTSIECFLVG